MKRATSKGSGPRAPRAGATGAAADRLGRAERELAALRAECAHMHRLSMLGTLAGAVAHEFNNLLTPMSSFAQMAQAHPEDAALGKKALEKVVEGTEQLADIAASLLGMARRDDATDRASVLECVNDALMCLARPPSKNRVRLDVDVDPRLVVAIQPVLLRQVILNLILNAMKAMRPDGGSLIIRARRVGSGGSGGSGGSAGSDSSVGSDRGSMGGSDPTEAACSTWNTPTSTPTRGAGRAAGPVAARSDDDGEYDGRARRGRRVRRAEVGGAAGGGTIEIEVQDTGPGVPRWMANRAFDPFVTETPGGGEFGVNDEEDRGSQSRGTRDEFSTQPERSWSGAQEREHGSERRATGGVRGSAAVYAGTGLGLSICAWLVGDAGGTIRHEEPAGGGARFVVTLPAGDGAVNTL